MSLFSLQNKQVTVLKSTNNITRTQVPTLNFLDQTRHRPSLHVFFVHSSTWKVVKKMAEENTPIDGQNPSNPPRCVGEPLQALPSNLVRALVAYKDGPSALTNA